MLKKVLVNITYILFVGFMLFGIYHLFVYKTGIIYFIIGCCLLFLSSLIEYIFNRIEKNKNKDVEQKNDDKDSFDE